MWDWNGTLKDDLAEMVFAMNATLVALGGQPIDQDTFLEHHCVPLRDFCQRLMGRPLTDAEWNPAEQTYLSHQKTGPVRLRAGAGALLALLHNQGYHQSLLSLSPHSLLVEEVAVSGTAAFFDLVEGRRGPDTGKTLALAHHLGALPRPTPPQQVLVIGDTLDDAAAARAAGAHAVLVTGGLQHPDHLHGSNVPVVGTLAEAVRAGLALTHATGTSRPDTAPVTRPSPAAPDPHRGR